MFPTAIITSRTRALDRRAPSGQFARSVDSWQGQNLALLYPGVYPYVTADTLYDMSEYKRHLTQGGAETAPTIALNPYCGGYGTKFSAQSQNGYSASGDSAQVPASFTLSAWSYNVDDTAYHCFLCVDHTTFVSPYYYNGIKIRPQSGSGRDKVYVDLGGSSGSDAFVGAGDSFDSFYGKYSLIVATYDDDKNVGVIYTFADGVATYEVTDSSVFSGGTRDDSGDVTIRFGGQQGYVSSFDGPSGHMWDARLYNRALSRDEVFALYDPGTRWDAYQSYNKTFFLNSTAGGSTFNKTVSESFAFTDAPLENADFIAAIAEALSLLDTASETSAFAAAVVESLALSDVSAETISGVIAAFVSESLVLGDTATKTAVMQRVVADAIALSDTTTETAAFVKAVLETFALSDSTDATTALLVSVVESLVFSDTSTEAAAFAAAVNEALGLADTATETAVLFRAVIDALALTDLSAAAGGVEEISTRGGSSMTLRQMRRLERQQLLAMIREDDEVIASIVASLMRRGKRLN